MFRLSMFLFAVVCALVIAPSIASAQLYLSLIGSQQGAIEGDVVDGPLTGRIAIESFSIGANTPINPQTGLPAGPVFISELSLSKSVDGATIGLLRALGDIESMSSCVFEAWTQPPQSGGSAYLRITLTNARVSTYNVAAAGPSTASEFISFAFDNLEWRDLQTGEVYNYGSSPSSVEPGDALARYAVQTTPNPTSGETRFDFRLPESGPVAIDVFDFRGRHVATVFDGQANTTQGIVSWDGNDATGRPVASGVYLVKMRTGEWLTTHKMSVLR